MSVAPARYLGHAFRAEGQVQRQRSAGLLRNLLCDPGLLARPVELTHLDEQPRVDGLEGHACDRLDRRSTSQRPCSALLRRQRCRAECRASAATGTQCCSAPPRAVAQATVPSVARTTSSSASNESAVLAGVVVCDSDVDNSLGAALDVTDFVRNLQGLVELAQRPRVVQSVRAHHAAGVQCAPQTAAIGDTTRGRGGFIGGSSASSAWPDSEVVSSDVEQAVHQRWGSGRGPAASGTHAPPRRPRHGRPAGTTSTP